MKPHDVEPSLLPAEPGPELLDDGFSPPPAEVGAPEQQLRAEPASPMLNSQSPF
jgi:hypothetical protein